MSMPVDSDGCQSARSDCVLQEHPVLRALLDILTALEVEETKPVKEPVDPAYLRNALAAYNRYEFKAGKYLWLESVHLH